MLATILALCLAVLPPPRDVSKPAVTGLTVGSLFGVSAGATMMGLSSEKATPRLARGGRIALFSSGAALGVASVGLFAVGLTYAVGRGTADESPEYRRKLRRRAIGLLTISGLGAGAGIGCGAATVFGRECPLGLTVAGASLAVSGALFGGLLLGLSLRQPSQPASPVRSFSLSGRF